MYEYALCMCMGLKGAYRKCWMPWNWSYRLLGIAMWVLVTAQGCLQDQHHVLLPIEPSLQPQLLKFHSYNKALECGGHLDGTEKPFADQGLGYRYEHPVSFNFCNECCMAMA